MKNIFLLLFFHFIILNSFSQNAPMKSGPIIADFGKVFTIENPDLVLDKNQQYKVVFDVYTDEKNNKDSNPFINTVARFLNMHAQHGVPLEHMDLVLVLHGKATKDALSDETYQREFRRKNPNTELLKALKNVHVKTYVCGQSFAHAGYKKEDLSSSVALSLSALTALVHYQTQGYQLITFN